MENKGGGLSGENTVVLIIIIVILGAAHYIKNGQAFLFWTGLTL